MMIRYFLFSIAFFVFCIKTTFAQDSTSIYSIKIDSLYQLIDSHQNKDEELVVLLNEYARVCFYNQDFKNGLIATSKSRILSNKLNFTGGEIMYCLTMSLYNGSGQMSSYYRMRAERLSKDQKLAKYYVTLQEIEFQPEADWEKLKNLYKEILKHLEKPGDKETEANVLSDLSYFSFMQQNYEESLQTQEKSIQLYRELDLVFPMFLLSSRKIYNLDKLGREGEIKELEMELVEFVSQNENANTIGMITTAMASGYNSAGRYGLAVEYLLKSISAFEQHEDSSSLFVNYLFIARAYSNLVMYDKAADIYEKAIAITKKKQYSTNIFDVYNRAVFSNYYIQNYDKAREYMDLALQEPDEQTRNYYKARQYSLEGQILKDQLEYSAAIPYLQRALKGYTKLGKTNGKPFMTMYIAECYQQMGDYQKALDNALLSLEMEEQTNLPRTKVNSELSLMLSEIYEELGQREQAYQYLKKYQEIRAENDKQDATNRLADAEVRDILEKSQRKINDAEQERAQADQENRIQRLWIFSILGALISAIILAFVLYRNNKNKQKANALLKEQKEEIESTLEKLESTQSQLIQSEKMASLGELTAGIAHEIQNPLNFVNNFSEVNAELVEELREEAKKGNLDEVQTIASDIEENEKKIKHHGKRAEGIVKGMLQHSRTSQGEKELTDINNLADEYLRLAYHGLRANDKSFYADFKTDFDESIPKINVIPQDIGRVLLNLINNAFYAVDKKLKEAIEDYNPEVIISTKKLNKSIEIIVSDNGDGIPEQVRDKIFQPFFTTKPTGSGTGLGLSLSYDIVKAHGGKIKLERESKEGALFILTLPII